MHMKDERHPSSLETRGLPFSSLQRTRNVRDVTGGARDEVPAIGARVRAVDPLLSAGPLPEVGLGGLGNRE